MTEISTIEANVLELWKRERCFEQQNTIAKERGYPKFRFLNGPPFVSGKLHHGHLLAGSVKDAITRFWAQNGREVERIATFDCLGLPAELHAQKLIGGQDIRQYVTEHGIGAFNDICYSEATTCAESWIPLMDKVGFWLDFDKNRRLMTMDTRYMETVWSVIAQLYTRGLIYRGYKVMPYSTGCQTTLSKSEATLNYRDVVDKSVIIKFRLLDTTFNPTFNELNILIWTTTIWSLVSNLAVCVNPDLEYCIFFLNGERNIALKSWVKKQQIELRKQVKSGKRTRKEIIYDEERDTTHRFNIQVTRNYANTLVLFTNEIYIMETLKGSDLGQDMFRYEPLFPFFEEQFPRAFRILCDRYVNETDGCGCVHLAPAHGDEDFRVCIEHGIIKRLELDNVPCPIDDFGRFTDQIPFIKGQYFKESEKSILDVLKHRGKVYEIRDVKHSYPFCWRTNTPLIYKLCPSIFINIENPELKSKMLENIEEIEWQPTHAGERYKKWMEDTHDWCISRSRYWGTPIPLWTNEDWTEVIVINNIQTLCEYSSKFKRYVNECEESGETPRLYRQMVDDIEIVNPATGNTLRRVNDVLDCWVESACMPIVNDSNDHEPLDFVGEGSDQVRCWFAYMQMIGSAIHGKQVFKRAFTNGLVLTEDGSKMSKSAENYTPPEQILEQYGADALRLYLLSTNAGENVQFRDDGVKMIVKNTLLYLINILNFFKQTYELACKTVGQSIVLTENTYTEYAVTELQPIDVWLLSEFAEYKHKFGEYMRDMNISQSVRFTQTFVENLSKWYVNLSKHRFKLLDESTVNEYMKASSVLYFVLYGFGVISAPIVPFMSEHIYQTLMKLTQTSMRTHSPISVHHIQHDTIVVEPKYINVDLIRMFDEFKSIVETCRNIRGRKVMSHKLPFSKTTIVCNDEMFTERIEPLIEHLKDTINTIEMEFVTDETSVNQYMTFVGQLNMRNVGRKFRKDIRVIVNEVNQQTFTRYETMNEYVTIHTPCGEFNLKVGEDGDITFIIRFVECDENHITDVTNDGHIGVMVDVNLTDEVKNVYEVKRFLRFVQQMRKETGLIPTDEVEYYYQKISQFDTISSLIEMNKDHIQVQLGARFEDIKNVTQVLHEKMLLKKQYDDQMIIYMYQN